MAKLLDVTGEVLGEGDPLEIVVLARELDGRDAVVGEGEDLPRNVEHMYDDVGVGFDPEAVWKQHQDQIRGLKAIKPNNDTERKSVAASIKNLTDREAHGRSMVREAAAIRDKARARVR